VFKKVSRLVRGLGKRVAAGPFHHQLKVGLYGSNLPGHIDRPGFREIDELAQKLVDRGGHRNPLIDAMTVKTQPAAIMQPVEDGDGPDVERGFGRRAILIRPRVMYDKFCLDVLGDISCHEPVAGRQRSVRPETPVVEGTQDAPICLLVGRGKRRKYPFWQSGEQK